MNTNKLTMYKNHKNGVGTWSIWCRDGIIHISHSATLNGAAVTSTETVKSGKQSRTLRQQIISRIQSRVNKQKDKGYVWTYEEALKPPTNSLGMVQPMLAQSIKRVSLNGSFFIQPKLDGHRCLVAKHEGSVVAYSRQGKIIDTIDHILEEIDIPEGTTIDGELYCHGQSLQTIASWAKRLQPSTSKLSYHVYDLVSSMDYKGRLDYLKKVVEGNVNSELVHTQYVTSKDFDLSSALNKAIQLGYEGLIARSEVGGYEAGRRSKTLIKIKKMQDAEFTVVDITPSADGWGVLTMITSEGKRFRASAPGNVGQKTHVLKNKDDYVGREVTVEYSELTKDKIPFHPVATRWREDL